jgi:hypothetical protein
LGGGRGSRFANVRRGLRMAGRRAGLESSRRNMCGVYESRDQTWVLFYVFISDPFLSHFGFLKTLAFSGCVSTGSPFFCATPSSIYY